MNGPGKAAPQCGAYDNQSVESRFGERHPRNHNQQHRGWYSRGYLPHFDSPHVIQHITYRLADSIPRAVLVEMQSEIERSVRDDEKRKAEMRRRIEAYLDAGHGSCVLQIPEIAAVVEDTWLRFDDERYRLFEWVVMPNHGHVLIEQFENVPLGKILLSWKNYTARFINEYLSRTGVQRAQVQQFQTHHPQWASKVKSQVWQREYWDRFIRNDRHFEAVRNYIIMNPVKAGLAVRPEDWPWGSARFRKEDHGII
jgi:putative transposase